MDVLYAKTILYSYINLDAVSTQIDELVERKARTSFSNYSPAISQFESIVQLTYEKDIVHAVKLICDKILSKFTEEDLTFFRYKYFKNMSKKEVSNFDFTSRTYFRKQVKLAQVFADKLEKNGIDNEFFEKKCLQLEFFKQLLKGTKEHEKLNIKNKPKTPKSENKT